MALVNRTLETMVDSVLNNIVNADIGITDIGRGSVIRTIIESLLSELEIMYYQSNIIYDSKNIDTAFTDDLDNLVSLFGITRNIPTKATSTCTFSRSIPAVNDILIPAGTTISTYEDSNGNVIEFITLDDATLLTNTTYIDVDIEAVDPGYLYVNSNQLVIMNTPIIGIESVTNSDIIDGGIDTETDDELRIRSKSSLSKLGKGTCDAIRDAILDMEEISDVIVIDMARGIGTCDIIISTIDIIDPNVIPQGILDRVNAIVADTKPAGIDIAISYPTVIHIDISVDLVGTISPENRDIASEAISTYVDSLGIGAMFIINQMERYVLNYINDDTIDIITTLPLTNLSVGSTAIIKPSVITVGGVV